MWAQRKSSWKERNIAKGKWKWRKEHLTSQRFILPGSLHCFSTHFTERDSGSVASLRITLLIDKRQGNKVIKVTFLFRCWKGIFVFLVLRLQEWLAEIFNLILMCFSSFCPQISNVKNIPDNLWKKVCYFWRICGFDDNLSIHIILTLVSDVSLPLHWAQHPLLAIVGSWFPSAFFSYVMSSVGTAVADECCEWMLFLTSTWYSI